MNWWGKVIGAAIGLILVPILGSSFGVVFVILGIVIGHFFDQGMSTLDQAADELDDVERIREAFFTATFSVMGFIAKADGKVTTDEIELATSVMDKLELGDEKRKVAQDLFRQGKQTDFPLDDILEQFRQECHWGQNLIQMFMEIQFSMVLADGVLHPAEADAIYHIGARLGFSRIDLDEMLNRMRAETEYAYYYTAGADEYYEQQGASKPKPAVSELELAYQVLGVTPKSTNDEIKIAYRRLINQHHPDKLVSKGLPPEMMELAKQKSQEITTAYQTVKKARQF